MTVSGWLFDAYPVKDRMVVWIKTEDGQAVRLEDKWSHSIYAASESRQTLYSLAANESVCKYARSGFVSRYERLGDYKRSEVLQLTLNDSKRAVALANTIEDLLHDDVRLYNVDVLPPQAYFYERDLFPLAKCSVEQNGSLKWSIQDDLLKTDYEVPDFRIVHLDVRRLQQSALPKSSDRIASISLTAAGERVEIQKQSEQDALVQLEREIARLDPDFIFTIDGDESVFPYLVERAEKNKTKLVLSREDVAVAEPSKEGITYFSYGKVHYRPSSAVLYGRIHFDRNNSFIFDHSSLHGLYELARLCRIPLHHCARATIGRCLSSMQFYHAYKRGLLVPWKPVNTERWKSFNELFVADRGGLIFEPVVGVHENVAEFDFAALYPSIMMKRNVSGETVNCECCSDSTNTVQELGYHLCEKRRGIVSQALELPLLKRAMYKRLKKSTADRGKFEIYETRQSALKWIGVVSFGYLGHANSKFGLIDSHIVVCAIDREVLIKARNEIESRGFTNLHGIVDSLWLRKDGATESEYAQLKEPIEKTTGYDVSFEGVYKWIVFLPSKQNAIAPVPNRYYGCFQDGTIKDRGIETRRHDTPPLFSRFQREALEIMARGNNTREVVALMPAIRSLLESYKARLRDRQVAIEDLVFTKSVSKDSGEYSMNTVETSAIYQLEDEGKLLRGGQTLQYVVTDYYRKNSRQRSVPVELLEGRTRYDARRYIELLSEVCNAVTKPFGFVDEVW